MNAPNRMTLTLAVLLCPVLPVAAETTAWSTTLAGQASTSFEPHVVRPLPSGGVVVSGLDAQHQPWTVRLDADLQSVGNYRFGQLGWTPIATYGSRSVAALPAFNDGRYQPDAARLCSLRRDVVGLDLRTYSDQSLPAAYGNELVRFDLDAFGAHYATYESDHGWIVARFGLDCRREDFAGFGHATHVVATPNARAAYVVGQRDLSSGQELVRVSKKQVLWRYVPDQGLAPRIFPFPASADGEALFRLANTAGMQEHAERWSAEGQRRWTRELPLGRAVRHMIGLGADTLLLEGPRSGQVVDVLRLVDAAGAERWQAAASAPYFAGEFSTPFDTDNVWIRLQRSSVRPDLGFDVVRVGLAGAEAYPFPPGVYPWVLRGDGSVIVTDETVGPHQMQQRYLDRPDVRNLPVQLPAPAELGGLKRMGENTLIALRMADGRTRVSLLRPDGTMVWDSLLPAVTARPAPARSYDLDYLVAANTERACLWQADGANQISHISCVRLADGTQVYDWIPAPYRRHNGEPVLSVRPDGTVQAVGGGCLFDVGPVCRNRVERFMLAADGSVLARAELGSGAGGDDAFDYHVSSDAGHVAIQMSVEGQVQLRMIGPTGSLISNRTLAAPLRLLDVDVSGRLLALETSAGSASEALVLIGSDGTHAWRHPLAQKGPITAIDGALLSSGGAVVAWYRRPGQMEHSVRLDSQGQLQWERQVPQSPAKYRVAERVDVSEADGLFVRHSIHHAPGDRLVAYSLADGRPLDGVSIPQVRNSEPLGPLGLRYELGASGDLTFALEGPSAGMVRAGAIRLAISNTSTAPLGPMLGMWYSPDTSGQGLFIDQDPGTGTSFAAWFTFAASGGQDASQLRWFTLVANGPSSDARIDFRVMKNTGGQFASPPSTTAAQVGTASLRRTGCDAALLEYRFDDATEGGRGGAIPLQRLSPGLPACQATDTAPSPVRLARSGAWYAPEHSGQGVVLDFHPTTNGSFGHLSGAWFTYDAQPDDPTAQHWFTLAGAVASGPAVEVPIYRTLGGALDAEPTSNTWKVGVARLTFQTCSRARLEYRFDDNELAHEFAGRSGSLELQRLGECGG